MTADSGIAGPVQVGTGTTQLPAAPTSLTAALQAGPQVLLTWTDNANNETQFAVERKVGTGSFSTLVSVGPKAGTGSVSYTDTAVAAGATYTYRVAAVNSAGLSAYSNTSGVTIGNPPAAPANVTATAAVVGGGTNARVTLTWTDVAGETGYTIQRATNAAFTANLVTGVVRANAVTFVTGNVPRSTAFYFRIQAFNGAGPSAWVNATPFPIITP